MEQVERLVPVELQEQAEQTVQVVQVAQVGAAD
jgi:hypothetical protein